MTKYRLDYSRTIYYSIEVEAETIEEAIDIAEDKLGDCDYCYEEGRDSLLLDDCSEVED